MCDGIYAIVGRNTTAAFEAISVQAVGLRREGKNNYRECQRECGKCQGAYGKCQGAYQESMKTINLLHVYHSVSQSLLSIIRRILAKDLEFYRGEVLKERNS